MDDVEEQILSYPHLSPEEQRDVEAYVEAHPEWAPLLRDVRTLEGLAQDVQGDLPSDALLATYIVAQHFHLDAESPPLQKAFSRLEARLAEDDALRRKAETAQRRFEEARSAIDPVAHFEQVTGHTLEEAASSQASSSSTTASENRDARSSSDSVLDVLFELPMVVQRAAVAVVLLVGIYGVLYVASVGSQSTLERLAAVEVSDQVVDSYYTTETRSIAPEADTQSVDDLYLEALSSVREARTSTLGLFPQYDTERLNRAEELFREVLAEVEPGSFLALEAHFYLGKVALAQGEVEAARSHFKTVVKREGRKASEAYEILKTLQEEYPLQDS